MGPEFKIEKDIPIPLRLREQMPLDEMEVGDSFFVTTPENKTQQQHRIVISNNVKYYSRITGKHFTVRNADSGVRVWRTENR